jgi:hypothetical protein
MSKSYFLILFFQAMFNIFKVLEIKYTYENKIKALLLNSVWINLMALGSAYYSLDGMFRGDYYGIIFYIAGSVIGKWIAMTQYENYRSKIYSLFNKKEDEEKIS